MGVLTLSSFQILQELYRTEQFTAYHAQQLTPARDVRVTVFDRELSDLPQFRAAFRKDRDQLENLHHDTIVQYLGYGEADGSLFYFAEYLGGRSLQQRIDQGQQFTWDEIADLGWQVASALQYAHNLGVSHGGLTPATILITDPLRVKVAGFGVYRWIAAATDDFNKHTEADWLNSQSADLAAFGNVLETLVAACSELPEDSRPIPGNDGETTVRSVVEGLIRDLRNPRDRRFPATAREIQGRLGNLLLSVAGESIEIVDHRAGQSYGRRSIVDELFEDAETAEVPRPQPSQTAVPRPANHTSLLVLAAAIVIALVVVAAVWLTRGS